jgi:BirA family biotin operon repressor/biotin-[acetyl-CoA-carboxylase] ligase
MATQFDVSRAAIWKAVRQLRELGTAIEAVPRQGYHLAMPASPLDVAGVTSLLSPAVAARLRHGECAGLVASTNTVLLERGAPPPGRFDFLTAEHQSAGRGRRGRSWLAPPGGAICLSFSWSFDALASQMGALSLAIGVAALRALARCGIAGVQLKWPNDLVTPDGKLGGILIEMRSESAGPVQVVAGIGINVALDRSLRERIDELGRSAVDLASLHTSAPHRNAVVAAVLEESTAALELFGREGFAPFREEYAAADALRDRQVTLQGAHAALTQGIARGTAHDGALIVEHEGRGYRIMAGEITVRTSTS